MCAQVLALQPLAMTMGLLGGLAIFLFGMGLLTDSLKAAAGGGLRALLARVTRGPIHGVATGTLVTAVVQSSSVTTVLVVGFASAGLLTLQQTVGVIMGANIGTTVTAQIIAFKVTEYALALVALGFAAYALPKRERVHQFGGVALGLGFVFLGMGLMSEATAPLRDHQPFVDFMLHLENRWLAIGMGAAFTAIVQSSSATTGLIIILAGQGLIRLETGIALALGANVGTCVTALLAAIGRPRIGVQVALVHLVFNLAGVLLWVGFIGLLAELVRRISPVSPTLDGAARLAAETPRQIANAHTIFNIGNTLLLIWFARPIAALVGRLAPVRPGPVRETSVPRFLDETLLQTPSLALERVRLETARLGDLAVRMIAVATPDPGASAGPQGAALAELAQDAHTLRRAILVYARRLLAGSLSKAEVDELEDILLAAAHFHSIADTISINLRAVAAEWRSKSLRAGDETLQRARELHGLLTKAAEDAVRAVRERDRAVAQSVLEIKPLLDRRADAFSRHVTVRLASDAAHRESTHRLELAWLEIVKRLFYFARRAAKTLLEDEAIGPEASNESTSRSPGG